MSKLKRELPRQEQHGVVEVETIEGEGVPFPEVSRRERRRLRKNGSKPVRQGPTLSEQHRAAPERLEHDFSNSSLARQIEEGDRRKADPCGQPKGYCQCGRWRFGEDTDGDEMCCHKYSRNDRHISAGLYLVTVYDREGHNVSRFSHEDAGEIRKFLASHDSKPTARVWLVEKLEEDEVFVCEDEDPLDEYIYRLNEVTEEFEDCLYSGLKALRQLMGELKEKKKRALEKLTKRK